MAINCSICGLVIKPHPVSGWDKGHNAQPVNAGRCCDVCNELIVIPRRIADMMLNPNNEPDSEHNKWQGDQQ